MYRGTQELFRGEAVKILTLFFLRLNLLVAGDGPNEGPPAGKDPKGSQEEPSMRGGRV